MARPLRVEFEGAVYHVMARGNERRNVFRDDQDRKRFLETLAEMVEQFGTRVHAYCLMPNHYHLLLETPRANLSRAVGWLQITYTVRFNRRHRRSGHLFQGRFKAQLVEADEYARWLVEYIHLNPVRPRRRGEPIAAERAVELEHYEWSSHRDYAGLRRKPPAWLCLDWRRYWGATVPEAQREYRGRIRGVFAKAAVDSPWGRMRGGLVLGGEGLWERAQQLIAGKDGLEEAVWSKNADMERVGQRVNQLTEQERDDGIKMWAQVKLAGKRKSELARQYGYRDGSGVAYAVRQLEARARDDQRLARKLSKLKEQIYGLRS
jgi:putative transposase